MEELRTQTQYQPANDPLGLSKAATQEIVNRLLGKGCAMTICTGAPAELHALQYVEGTLSEFEVERFEEHYFDCPVCLQHVQAIQAVAQEIASQPIVPIHASPRLPLAWPARVWAMGAIAALLLISVFTFKSLESRPEQPTVAQSQPKSSPQAEPASAQPIHVSQLADLTLPTYFKPNLRGESLDARFEAGMVEYAKGNCRGAIADLSLIPAESAEARAGQFYSGACQMHLGNLAAASALLHKVADAGDSAQQEAALYVLAQIALANNDVASAHAYLLHTVSLRGDFESRAREQEQQMAKLINQNQPADAKAPATK
jgi:hypothetical protein